MMKDIFRIIRKTKENFDLSLERSRQALSFSCNPREISQILCKASVTQTFFFHLKMKAQINTALKSVHDFSLQASGKLYALNFNLAEESVQHI